MKFVIPVLLLLSCLPHAAFGQQYIVTVQPIQVRMDDGTLDPGMQQFPAAPIAVEATNKIYAQAGVTVEFLPTVYYDETDFLVIDSTDEFRDLSLVPGHGQHADPLVINMWFVQDARYCDPPVPCAIYLSWVGANGLAVRGEYVDILFVVAHVVGYNFGLQNSGSEDLPRENLMHIAPYSPQSLDDIYPDGLGYCYLNPQQIFTIQGSPFSVEQAVSADSPQTRAVVLHQNIPNPFNPRTTITYSMASAGHVELEIYDLAGRHVITQVSEWVSAGEHRVHWNGKNSTGEQVASGVYLYRLKVGDYIETRRMVLVR